MMLSELEPGRRFRHGGGAYTTTGRPSLLCRGALIVEGPNGGELSWDGDVIVEPVPMLRDLAPGDLFVWDTCPWRLHRVTDELYEDGRRMCQNIAIKEGGVWRSVDRLPRPWNDREVTRMRMTIEPC